MKHLREYNELLKKCRDEKVDISIMMYFFNSFFMFFPEFMLLSEKTPLVKYF